MGGVGRHLRQASGFSILFVCTGNICRSPFAEILTRHLLVGRLGGRAAAAFAISSAGVQAVVGAPMFDATRRELAPWRLDGMAAEHFRARQLRSSMVREVDLVLGLNVRHRSAVVEREPAALASTFALREFARLAAGARRAELPDEPVARAHALVELARSRRGLAPPTLPQADTVTDPMGGPQAAHHAAALLIREAVGIIVDAIAPRPVAARQA
jgi:protein-tyrosine phosphatase